MSHATHQSNLSAVWGEKKGVKQERKTSHNQIRKSSISPHLVCVTAYTQRSQQCDERDISDLLNSSKQDTNQAEHMLDNLCGNNFVEKGVEIWLVLFYIHLCKDGVTSVDYARITLI